MAGEGPRRPFVEYADYKKDPNNYVRVGVDIKGMKKKSFGKGASNADIQFDFSERSFKLSVTLNNKGKKDLFEYEVKQLPDTISTDPKKTYWKIKQDDEIILMLCKEKPDSWERYLSGVGLETAD